MTNIFGGFGTKEDTEIDFSKVAKRSHLATKVSRPVNSTPNNLVAIRDESGEIKDSGIGASDLLKTPMNTDLNMNNHKINGLDQTYPPRDYSQAATWGHLSRVGHTKVDKSGDAMTGGLNMQNNIITGLVQNYPPDDNSQAMCWGQGQELAHGKLNKSGDVMTGDLKMSTGKDKARFMGCLDLTDGKGFSIGLGNISNQLQYEITPKYDQPVKLLTASGFLVKLANIDICLLGNNIYFYRDIFMQSHRIHSLKDPHESTDAATKRYVDSKKAIITVWAEETGGLKAKEFEWSFGNGSTGGTHRFSGYTLAAAGRIIRMALSSVIRDGDAAGEVRVHISINGVEQKIGVIKPEGQRSAFVIFDTPLEVSAGSTINFVSKTNNKRSLTSVVSILIELDL